MMACIHEAHRYEENSGSEGDSGGEDQDDSSEEDDNPNRPSRIDLHKRSTYRQGYLGFAKMYLELLELLLELLLQQQLQQLQVHFGKTQVALAIGTPFVKV